MRVFPVFSGIQVNDKTRRIYVSQGALIRIPLLLPVCFLTVILNLYPGRGGAQITHLPGRGAALFFSGICQKKQQLLSLTASLDLRWHFKCCILSLCVGGNVPSWHEIYQKIIPE